MLARDQAMVDLQFESCPCALALYFGIYPLARRFRVLDVVSSQPDKPVQNCPG